MNKRLQTLIIVMFAFGLFVLSGCAKQKSVVTDYTYENDDFVEEDL